MRSRSNASRGVSSDTVTYTATANPAAVIATSIPSSQNCAGSGTRGDGATDPATHDQTARLVSRMPTRDTTEPVIVAAHAPPVVPLRQYSPPMIAAPAPPVKTPAVT